MVELHNKQIFDLDVLLLPIKISVQWSNDCWKFWWHE